MPVKAAPPTPRFSVVVPTKGRPRYLAGCLRALAALDYERAAFEVIVVNDGGGEAIGEVAELGAAELPLRVVAPERTGPAGARNAGAAAARGSYVAFTDDDCEPEPGWLAAFERRLAEDPGAAVGGTTVNGAPFDPRAAASQAVVDALHEQFNRDPNGPRFFASSNVAFPADSFARLGGFDEAFRYAEDREICERWIASGHRFVAAPDAVVRHMRTLTPRQFLRQHYGYGRGAWAFARARGDGSGPDRARVVSAIGRRARRRPAREPATVPAYLAASQIATAAGFAREAIGAAASAALRSPRSRGGPPEARR